MHAPVMPGAAGLSAEAHISVEDALAQSAAGDLILVDIRTPQEWQQTGIPKGAHILTMNHPAGVPGFIKAISALMNGDTDAKVALICRTGSRTGYMQQFLWSQGFRNVLNVTEGMAGSFAGPGWLRKGLPVEPYTD